MDFFLLQERTVDRSNLASGHSLNLPSQPIPIKQQILVILLENAEIWSDVNTVKGYQTDRNILVTLTAKATDN